MNITVTGTMKSVDIGPGAWALITDANESYEIYQPAFDQLLKVGQKVKASGKIRDDVMTLAMIGPVFQVLEFEVL